MYQRHRERLEFLVVYIREAHPADGWVAPANVRQNIHIRRARTIEERADTAAMACRRISLTIPCLLDDMEDSVMRAYAGWPDRIFVIDQSGIVRFVTRRGPAGFRPDHAERFIRRWLDLQA